MLNKFRYHIDYLVKTIPLGFTFFVVWDLVFYNEFNIVENIILVIFLSLIFLAIEFYKTSEKLINLGFPINSIKELSTIEPLIKIKANSISEIIERIKESKHFKKVTFQVIENGSFFIKRKKLISRIVDEYKYTVNDINQEIEIKVDLSKSNYYKDSRQILDLGNINKIMTA